MDWSNKVNGVVDTEPVAGAAAVVVVVAILSFMNENDPVVVCGLVSTLVLHQIEQFSKSYFYSILRAATRHVQQRRWFFSYRPNFVEKLRTRPKPTKRQETFKILYRVKWKQR